MNKTLATLLITTVLALYRAGAAPAAGLADTLLIPGGLTDLSNLGPNVTDTRLGGLFSDMYYDRHAHVYYGVTDRGPGGGLISYTPRIQQFSLDVNPADGTLGNFQLQRTILFKTSDGSQSFDGRLPTLLNGSSSDLGLSFDPEGIVVSPGGHFFVSDEYGPSVYEFAPVEQAGVVEARFVNSFVLPSRVVPRDSLGEVNYVAERQSSPALISGRQDNRGFEGLAISPDGTTLWAAMQDPLAEEGTGSQGRRSRNVRIVRFDVASGAPTGQFIYQLEDIATINPRIPGTTTDFTANEQGRQIGVSSLTALNGHQLLVLERDTRGVNPETLATADPLADAVGAKRVYQIDLAGASDVTNVSLAGTNTLPAGVVPMSKSLLLDIQAALVADGQIIPERTESLAIGPLLQSGEYALLIAADNDFSIADLGGTLFDVYTDGTTGPVGGDPAGRTLFPSRLYSFATPLPDFIPPVPEPATCTLAFLGLVTLLAAVRRRLDAGK